MSDPQPVILVVDDEPDNVAFLERTFRGRFRVLTAGSGKEALALLHEHAVDVIVTDQRMAPMTGTQLLQASLEINPKIIKIILSAHTDTTDILSAINVCRINHYLVKPITPDRLLGTVEKALELAPQAARYD